MEYVVALLAVAAFGYFIYTRFKAAEGSSGGTGGDAVEKPPIEDDFPFLDDN